MKAKPIFKARHELVKGLTDNPELALKFLERKLKSEFSTRTETTGKDGEAVEIIIKPEFPRKWLEPNPPTNYESQTPTIL